MLNQNNIQKNILNGIMWTVITGAVLLFTLLMLQASSLGDVTEQATRYVSIAGVQLIELSKQVVDGGFAATFAFRPALGGYFALLTITGITIGLLKSQINPK